MSEPATETRSSGSTFTRKIGPLPLWGWMGIGLALGMGYYMLKGGSSSSAASTASTTTGSSQTTATSGTGTQSYPSQNISNHSFGASGGVANVQSVPASTGTASTDTTGTASASTGTASTGTTSTGTTSTSTGTTSTSTATVKVPNVTGQRAVPAMASLKAAGLTGHTTPTITSNHEWQVTSQTPAAGKSVAKGSTVALAIKQIS